MPPPRESDWLRATSQGAGASGQWADVRRSPALLSKEPDMGKLDGKIALVTGGNSGIGRATAKEFVNEGAYVFITGRRDPELTTAVKELGRNVNDISGDVSSLGDLDRLFA